MLQRLPLDMEAAHAKLAAQLFGVAMEAPRIGRFRVLEKLGSGGMGEVYAAFDKELDRRIAIKVLRDAEAGSAEHARLLREAQAMARLSHPNVVQVYEVGEHRGQIFIAMEFVNGRTLARWLADEERSVEEILAVFDQAGRGLHAAHAAGLVHRDFKPDNVLVGQDGRVRVVDFGLARGDARTSPDVADPATSRVDALAVQLTQRGALLGTPAFMSPEQYDGAPTDPRTDQFSFCVALFTALYKTRPFQGATVLALASAVHEGVVPDRPPDSPVPEWVHRALVTGLAPNPGHRHASMEVLLAELAREAPAARDPWRTATVLLALLLLFAVLGSAWASRARPPTDDELASVAALAAQARDAAARAHWVYPAEAAPRDTAILRIVALEALEGPAAPRALAEAHALRAVFADELADLGDTYWDLARPYARDFYAQALVFRPDDPRARARGGLTPGELADLRDKAIRGVFSAFELVAVEPLLVLASDDPDERARWLRAYEESRAGRRVLAPVPAPATPPLALAPTPAPTPDLETPRPGQRPRPVPTSTAAATPPATPAAESTPPAGPTRDPARSEELAREAEQARRRNRRDEAARLFLQALSADPDNPAALIGLSDLAFDDSRYGEAVDFAERATRLAPRKGDYHLRLGDAYFKVLRLADARRAYETAAELGHPRAQERLDKLASKLGP